MYTQKPCLSVKVLHCPSIQAYKNGDLKVPEKYQKMKDAREKCIAAELQALRQGLQDLANATRSNEAIVIMLIRGIITVGSDMYTAYRSLESATHVPTMISGLIAVSGGLPALLRAVSPIAATVMTTWILRKE